MHPSITPHLLSFDTAHSRVYLARLTMNGVDAEVPFSRQEVQELPDHIQRHPHFLRTGKVMQMLPGVPQRDIPAGVTTSRMKSWVDTITSPETTLKQKESAQEHLERSFSRPAVLNNRRVHQLEVSGVINSFCKKLELPPINKRIAAMCGLIHDLGHPPFGHKGEDTLKECLIERGLSPDMADHNKNGLRKAAEIGIPAVLGIGLLYHDGVPLSDPTIDLKFAMESLPGGFDDLLQHKDTYGIDVDAWPALEFQIAAIADNICNASRDLIEVTKAHGEAGPGVTFLELCESSPLFRETAYKRIMKSAGEHSALARQFKELFMDDIVDGSVMERLSCVSAVISALYGAESPDSVASGEKQFMEDIIHKIRNTMVNDAVEQTIANAVNRTQPLVVFSEGMQREYDYYHAIAVETRELFKERDHMGAMMRTLFNAGMDGENIGMTDMQSKLLSCLTGEEERAMIVVDHMFEMTDRQAYEAYTGLMQRQGISPVRVVPEHLKEVLAHANANGKRARG